MEDFLNIADLKWQILLVQGIGFLLLVYILKRAFFARIVDAVKSRQDEIKAAYDKSDQMMAEVQSLKSDYEKRMAEVEQEADRKLQEAVRDANETSKSIIQETREEAERIREKASQDIELEKKKALVEIRNEVVNLSILTSSKIIEKAIDEQVAEKLVDESIRDLEHLS
ncbi:MAG: F0F1 ATP synthase subunit B [Candidatus Hydrogenedentota bacterium]|nr:MAG: F0F1 ATP synthase subunit B [Candidatus Hydrogenedentota bacterium]